MPAAMRLEDVDRATEMALVEGLRAGEEAAFDVIYATFNARLFGFLLRLTRRREVAEELLEETWLRFVRHADRLQPDTHVAAWLFTVARNLHVSYGRTHRIESDAAGSLSLWPVHVAETPFDIAAQTEFERRLDAALADQPITLREAILLVAVEGMRPAEAADVCGITGEAMRQRLRRARTLLAGRLGYTIGEVRLRAGA